MSVDLFFLGGFVAAEGSFHRSADGRVCRFAVGLGASDRAMCEAFLSALACGRVVWSPRRRPHYDDEVSFVVGRLDDLALVVVPFLDVHLPPSHKREQYLEWRAAVLARWARRARPLPSAQAGRGAGVAG